MTMIQISAENHARLRAKAIYAWKETAKRLPDGRYSIEVDDEVLERLLAISPDMDVALDALLGQGVA
jgi:hypothetical protein